LAVLLAIIVDVTRGGVGGGGKWHAPVFSSGVARCLAPGAATHSGWRSLAEIGNIKKYILTFLLLAAVIKSVLTLEVFL
jgi:hypothetical protein